MLIGLLKQLNEDLPLQLDLSAPAATSNKMLDQFLLAL